MLQLGGTDLLCILLQLLNQTLFPRIRKIRENEWIDISTSDCIDFQFILSQWLPPTDRYRDLSQQMLHLKVTIFYPEVRAALLRGLF